MKVGRNDPCPCGSGKKYKACCQAQSEQRSSAPAPVDDTTRRKLFGAFEAYQRDRLAETVATCRSILQRHANQPDALHLLGLVAQRQGKLADALSLIDQAIRLAANDSMHSNRGIVLQATGRYDEAIAAYSSAIALNPSAAAVYSNMGACLQVLGRWDEALKAFDACLKRAPNHVPALNGRGYCLLMLGDLDAAENALGLAVALDPGFADVRTNLGVIQWAKGHLDAAIEHYRASLDIAPGQAEVWDRIGVALNDCNRIEQAREAFTKSYELSPNPIRRLRKTLLLSHVYASKGDQLAQRRCFEAGLDELIAAGGHVDASTAHLFCPAVFNLAYHGDDVLPTLRKVAAMYEALCPSLRFRAPHIDRRRPEGAPVRLGFFTAHVHDHPVAHCFADLVKALANDPNFQVFLISYQDLPEGDVHKPYENFSGQFVKIAKGHAAARQSMAALELDVLAYQDIGMDDVSYFLGYARLARVQCVMGGHPVTTGLPEMDIYLSSALGEPEGAQTHYSERLLAMDPGTALYMRPVLPAVFKDRVALGLPASGNLYICPMMLQKIHPDFDAAVSEILALDPQGQVIFFSHPNAGWELALQTRLANALDEAALRRLHFLPWIRNRDDFAAVNYHAAVVLDPFHFGIGSTAITTFAVGTPVVTWPAAFLRGRVGLVYARLMELPECVAESQRDYPALAVRIANDPVLRSSLSARILAHADRFFDSQEYLNSTRAFFHSLKDAPELNAAVRGLEIA